MAYLRNYLTSATLVATQINCIDLSKSSKQHWFHSSIIAGQKHDSTVQFAPPRKQIHMDGCDYRRAHRFGEDFPGGFSSIANLSRDLTTDISRSLPRYLFWMALGWLRPSIEWLITTSKTLRRLRCPANNGDTNYRDAPMSSPVPKSALTKWDPEATAYLHSNLRRRGQISSRSG